MCDHVVAVVVFTCCEESIRIRQSNLSGKTVYEAIDQESKGHTGMVIESMNHCPECGEKNMN